MALRYQVEAQGLNGIPYRADIYDKRFSGSVTTLRSDPQFVRLQGGSDNRDLLKPLWPKQLRLFVADDTDLSPLFGAADRDIRVELVRTDSSHKVFIGYLLTDFFGDNPYAAVPSVELRAIDGLTTLRSQTLNEIYSTTPLTPKYTDAIQEILDELYPSTLNVEFGVEWYPDEPALSSSDCPLEYLEFNTQNYREDRPEGNWFNLYDVLKDLLRTNGLVLRQVQPSGEDVLWQARQESALSSNGDLKVWRFDGTSTLLSGYPKTVDYSADLSSEEFEADHTREFERRFERVSVVHDHAPIETLIGNGGFEDQGDQWTLNSGSNYNTTTDKHDNLTTPFGSVQDNTYALSIEQTSAPASETYVAAAVQDLGFLEGFPPATAGNLELKKKGDAGVSAPVLKVGSNYLKDLRTTVKRDVNKGTGSVPVNPLDRPIPRGARVPFIDASQSQRPQADIVLSRRAPKGASELVGEISADIKSGWEGVYLGFGTTRTRLPLENFRSDQSWQSSELIFEFVDGSGNPVSGDSSFEIEFLLRTSNTVSIKTVWDDFSLGIEKNGRSLSQTTTTGIAPESGQDTSITVRTTQGPTSGSISRILGVTPNGSRFLPKNWGIGAGGGSFTLEELQAREALRYYRNHTERLALTFGSRNKAPDISGHELVTFKGTQYTVEKVLASPYSGTLELKLLEHADRGTSSIIYQTSVRVGDGSTPSTISFGSTGGTSPSTDADTLDGVELANISFSDISASRYTDGEAVDALQAHDGTGVDADTLDGVELANISFSDISASRYTDGEAVDALQAHDGTGVDSDTLDGVEGSKYARTDVNETFNNDVYVSGGSVGIGTTSPGEKLDVSGTIRSEGVDIEGGDPGHIERDGAFYRTSGQAHITVDDKLYIRDQGGASGEGGRFVFKVDADRLGIGTTSPSYALDVSGTGNFSSDLYASGNVGIGTTSPSYGLDVSSDAQITNGTAVNAVSGLTASGNGISTDWNETDQFRIVGANNALSFIVPADTNNREAGIQAGHESGAFSDFLGKLALNPLGGNVGIQNTSPSYDLDVSGTGNFTGDLYASGNVGIGTTSPSYALDVDGIIKTNTELRVGAEGRLREDSGDTVLEEDSGGSSLRLEQNNVSPMFINAKKQLDINFDEGNYGNVFRVYGNGNEYSKYSTSKSSIYFLNGVSGGEMYVSGDLGIGTTSPSYDLEVAGEIGRSYTQGRFGSGYILDGDEGTGQSYFEVDNARIRGTLRVHIFKKDIIRATNALLYVSDASPLTEDITTPSSTGNSFTLYVKNPVFDPGDEVRFKDDVGGSILQVIASITSNASSTTRGGQTVYSYSATLDSGTSITIPGGSVIVRTSGARMLLNAADANAPRQVLRNSSGNVRGVLGNQNGDYGFTSDTFGLSAGDPSGNHITVEPSNGLRMRDGSTTLAQLSGTALTLGSTDQIKFDPSSTPEAQIQGTLEMSTGGEIRNAGSDFTITSTGFDVLSASSQTDVRSYTATDSNGRVDMRLYGRSGGADLEAPNGSLDFTAKRFLAFKEQGSNTIADAFGFDLRDGNMEFGRVYSSSNSPNTPLTGMRVYAKKDSTGAVRPVYRRENGDEFYLDTGNAV